MDELSSLLLFHFGRYPLMDCADGVKLLHQSEFGCGHLAADREQSFVLLSSEAGAIDEGRADAPLLEPIGGGFCRVYLDRLPQSLLAPLHEAFMKTAAEETGSRESFLEKLSALETLARQGRAPFSGEALARYLEEYRRMGYPAVSHSARYREAYCPHYRVIRRSLASFLEREGSS